MKKLTAISSSTRALLLSVVARWRAFVFAVAKETFVLTSVLLNVIALNRTALFKLTIGPVSYTHLTLPTICSV